MQRRTREQSKKKRPWDCHDNQKDIKTLDGNGGQDGELEIMMLLLIEIEDGKPTERSARSRSSADTEYFLVSYRFPFIYWVAIMRMISLMRLMIFTKYVLGPITLETGAL